MERFRWFELTLPLPFQTFVSKIRSSKFNQKSQTGFIEQDPGDKQLQFKYYWSSMITRIIMQHDQTPTSESIATLCQSSFCLFVRKNRVWLRIHNPPRSSRDLLNKLEDLSGFGFYVHPVQFLTNNEIPVLASELANRITSIKLIRSLAGDGSVARIEAASKDGITQEDIDTIKGKTQKLELITFEINYQLTKGQLSINNSGVIKLSGNLTPFLLEYVEREWATTT